MKTLLILFISIACFNQSLFAQSEVSEAYEAELLKMIKISGQDQTYAIAIDHMLALYQQQSPEVSAEKWKKVVEVLKTKSTASLAELLAPIYAKHVTRNEIQELNKFYTTEIGAKLASVTPIITKETMQVGQVWGQSLALEIDKVLKEMKIKD